MKIYQDIFKLYHNDIIDYWAEINLENKLSLINIIMWCYISNCDCNKPISNLELMINKIDNLSWKYTCIHCLSIDIMIEGYRYNFILGLKFKELLDGWYRYQVRQLEYKDNNNFYKKLKEIDIPSVLSPSQLTKLI